MPMQPGLLLQQLQTDDQVVQLRRAERRRLGVLAGDQVEFGQLLALTPLSNHQGGYEQSPSTPERSS